jgi:hypothetical protein
MRLLLLPSLDRAFRRGFAPTGAFAQDTAGLHVDGLINAETGNLKLAHRLLGYSNINMTADVYTHISQELEREAARVAERAIRALCSLVVPRWEWEQNCSNELNRAGSQLDMQLKEKGRFEVWPRRAHGCGGWI